MESDLVLKATCAQAERLASAQKWVCSASEAGPEGMLVYLGNDNLVQVDIVLVAILARLRYCIQIVAEHKVDKCLCNGCFFSY